MDPTLKDEQGWPALKTIGADEKEFVANGTTYRIAQSLSYDRWKDMQLLEVELGYGASVAELNKGLGEAFDLLNKQKFAEAAVRISALRTGLAALSDDRIPTILQLCCLFVNRKDEDIRTITPELIRSKVDDWRAEGIDIVNFFTWALAVLPGFMRAYADATKPSSLIEKKQSEGRTEPISSELN